MMREDAYRLTVASSSFVRAKWLRYLVRGELALEAVLGFLPLRNGGDAGVQDKDAAPFAVHGLSIPEMRRSATPRG